MPRIAKKSVTIAEEPEQESEPEPEPEPEPESEPEPEPEPESEPPKKKPRMSVAKSKEPKLEPEPEPEPEPPKKKPGRPVGSRSKEPGKPRAKRVKIVEAVDLHTTLYVPEQPPQQQRIPNDPNTLMFQLLADHARTRSNRKSDLWKSWFNT